LPSRFASPATGHLLSLVMFLSNRVQFLMICRTK
jgi:hypothetical protein